MLKLARLALLLTLFCCYPMSGAEAALNKCTDGKRITYTTDPCEKTGLSSAGPIKDAITVMPHFAKPSNEPEQPGRAHSLEDSAPKNAKPATDVRGGTAVKPVSPLAEKAPGQ